MKNWIKVEVQRIAAWERHLLYTVGVDTSRVLSFRVFCVQCGHDDFRNTHEEAMNRGREMWRDHIPFDPDGVLSCWHWNPDTVVLDQPDAARWTPERGNCEL